MGRKLYSFQNFIKTKHPALNLSIYLTPKASIYRNATSDAHKVKDISIAEAIRYFCKVNELELNWTENKILIDIKPNPPPETILESKESDINYKTIWVKTIKSNPIKIEVDYLVAPPIINCNGEKFNDVSAVINHLNDIKEDAIIRGILFIYSSKATKKWDNPLLDELIRFTYPQNIDLYLKFCISKKTEYIYRKYLWLTPPSSKIEKHQNGK
jgi:hypothetical protein